MAREANVKGAIDCHPVSVVGRPQVHRMTYQSRLSFRVLHHGGLEKACCTCYAVSHDYWFLGFAMAWKALLSGAGTCSAD